MATKVLKGFREVPKQDGSGKVTIERVPYFGGSASDKIRRKKSRKVKTVSGGFAALFSPVKKG